MRPSDRASLLIPALVIFALSLAGCGSDDDDDDDDGNPAPVTNAAPTISGIPASSIDEDEEFVFTPTASDADGDTLSFSIQNQPAWASFDADTGTLSGTPVRADVRTYEDISIAVSDGEATASLAPFSVEVVQVSNLVVTGIASDAPLANATITVHAAGNEVTASAGADGSFTIPVKLRAGDFDGESLVRITAIGDGAQAQVELVTLVGDLAGLIEQAGDDETLDGADNNRINVSHLSTARYLLAIDNNDGELPADANTLSAAEDSIDTSLLLRTAGIIKLIVDEGVIQIPEGESTLSVLSGVAGETTNQQAIETLLAANGLTDEHGELDAELAAALAQAIEATLADDSILPSFDADGLIGSTVWTIAAHPDRVPYNGNVLRFEQDGTGTFYDTLGQAQGQSSSGSFTWTVEGGELEIVYVDSFRFSTFVVADPLLLMETYGFDQGVADFLQEHINELQGAQIRVDTNSTAMTSRLLSGAGGLLHVSSQVRTEYDIDEVLQLFGWQGALPRGSRTDVRDQLVYTRNSLASSLEQAPAPGENWAVPVIYQPVDARVVFQQEQGHHPDVFRLNDDGTTSMGFLSSASFDWSTTDEGLVFESGSERYLFTPFATDGHVHLALISYYVGGVLELQTAAWVARSAGEPDMLGDDLPRALPEYWQNGLNTLPASAYRSDGLLRRDFVFGVSFHADSTSQRALFFGDFAEGDCLEDPNTPCFFLEDGWTWTTAGNAIVQERGGSGSANRVRTWKVLRREPQTRYVVLEYELLDFGGGYDFFVFPRLNMHQVMDLSAWPEELADSGISN